LLVAEEIKGQAIGWAGGDFPAAPAVVVGIEALLAVV
jgi:hypothetical protein